MKILIAPGAFKHSLGAPAVARAIARGLARSGLPVQTVLLPIADGGNGTLDAFLALGGQRYSIIAHDPLGRPVEAWWGLLDDGETAIIEMAQASGLELLSKSELDPLGASTYGTGELLMAALLRGAKRIIIGLGGSATTDGGAGCMQALGVRFTDAVGEPLFPGLGGGALHRIAGIDATGLDPRWQDVEILIAADVENPSIGEQGAAAVFAPQKGAQPEQVAELEYNLRHFFTLIATQTGVDVRRLAGGGAAGAFSAGLKAFFPQAKLESGIDLLLNYSGFARHLADCALVVTGEGHMDSQTIHGKGPVGVARLARAHGVPTVALVGGLGVDDAVLHKAGIHAVLPIITHPMPLDEALQSAGTLIEQAALRLGYLLMLSTQGG